MATLYLFVTNGTNKLFHCLLVHFHSVSPQCSGEYPGVKTESAALKAAPQMAMSSSCDTANPSMLPVLLRPRQSSTSYLTGSYYRHLENPQDNVMPTVSQMLDGVQRSAFERDRNGDLRLWLDTFASACRFGMALGVIFLAIPLGVGMGLFPYVEALFYRFLVFFDKIPALSVLPILFIRHYRV
jgi:hypothetical protein